MKYLQVRPMTAQEEFDRGHEVCSWHYSESHEKE